MIRAWFTGAFLLMSLASAPAQNRSKPEDLSFLWKHASCDTCGLNQPLGFIGADFQRFYIHFDSVIHEPFRNYYVVSGKTRVKTFTDRFGGTLWIDSISLLPRDEYIPYQEGFIIGHYLFFEDRSSPTAGVFTGRFSTGIYFDSANRIHLNDLWDGADGWNNNQFEGRWTSFKDNTEKICNWGDYRIPSSGDLDGGAAEFVPQPKYAGKGWGNYLKAFMYYPVAVSEEERLKALKEEQRAWWKF